MKFIAAFLIICGLMFSSCKRSHEKAPEIKAEKTENVNEEVSQIIRNQIDQFKEDSLLIIDSDTLVTGSWISVFFTKNNFQPVWTNRTMLSNTADSLLKFINNAELYGLVTSDYYLESILQKISSFYNKSDSSINITRIYEVNILLTAAYFKLSVHLKKGLQDQLTFQKTWKATSEDSTVVNLLEMAMKSNLILQSLQSQEPKHEQYSRLRITLNIFLERIGEIKAGNISKEIQETKFTINDRNFNDTLNEIYYTIDSLKKRINQLNANIERWRWESIQSESKHILINIPSNTFKFYSNDSMLLYSKVITGKPETPTPSNFNSKISHFFIYPYWNVPYTIATKEILPKLKKDTTYLTSENFEVLDRRNNLVDPSTINWKRYSEKYFPFRLRQRDGTENTLGVLKFMFSNPYAIYLHDTNSRTLFSKENRWLSHGCIRLDKAKNFAQLICETSTYNFNTDSLNRYMEIKSRIKVAIYPEIPIHIRYYSIEADTNNVNFYPDIYQIDNKMHQALQNN